AEVLKPQQTEMRPRPRPEVTKGQTVRIKTGCGNLYITVNRDEHGLCECFTAMGKSGGCAASQAEAIARLISLALRSGVAVEAVIKELRGIRCPSPAWGNGGQVLSCADAIGIVLGRVAGVNIGRQAAPDPHHASVRVLSEGAGIVDLSAALALVKHKGACPDCGSAMKFESGCSTCPTCGFSECL
ncbi:MAG: TSCPD domain-containing protein, partial [Firmicutes bacterium]|nr:TSCPD domain-containing protein [Bacillota bacterium]